MRELCIDSITSSHDLWAQEPKAWQGKWGLQSLSLNSRQVQSQNDCKKKKDSIAYPPDKIWAKQKSPNSFDSKLQSRRTMSRPLRSITCSKKVIIPILFKTTVTEMAKNYLVLQKFTSYGVPSLNCTLTAAYFFFFRRSILLYKPSRSISRHLYFLLT
jgi:hypothetical protein